MSSPLKPKNVIMDVGKGVEPLTLSKLNHDLRSPLSAILGFVALLDDSELIAADRIDYIAAIRRAAEQIVATLDAAQAATSPANSRAPPQPGIKVSQLLVGKRVLLADDDPRLRQLTQFCLEKGGAKVVSARNGQEAVGLAIDGKFDVVLLDMEMPVMDGFEAARTLRNRGVTTPIVAFTAHSGPAEWDRCVAAGCSRRVTKPFEAEMLVRELAMAIESSTAVT